MFNLKKVYFYKKNSIDKGYDQIKGHYEKFWSSKCFLNKCIYKLQIHKFLQKNYILVNNYCNWIILLKSLYFISYNLVLLL